MVKLRSHSHVLCCYLAATAACVATSTMTGHARAADCSVANATCIDSDALWPSAGPSRFFSVASSETLGAGRVGVGALLSFQQSPIVLRKALPSPVGDTAIPAIGEQLTTNFLLSYGVSDRFEVDVVAPVTFYQSGTGLSSLSGRSRPVSTNAVHDLRVGGAFALVPFSRQTPDASGFGLTTRLDVSLPTGDRDAFAGERSVVVAPSLVFENRIGLFTFGAQAGFRFRETTRLLGQRMGSQGFLALGGELTVVPRYALSLTGEVFAQQGFVQDGISPVQWLAGAKWAQLLGSDFVLHLGGGGSFRSGSRAELLEPSYRFVLDLRYEPRSYDRDQDGVLDRDDKCPTEPEDKDGFEDTDGCPDPDNDHDGVPDFRDKCPNEAGFEDTDGCPEHDRDHDGIKDNVDKCPDTPEDKDGYQDEDGCPDGGGPKAPPVLCADGSVKPKNAPCDADRDGIADNLDRCPLDAEDKDGLLDEDGCPEKDADEDGVGDEGDKCPLEPETINGVADADGCPEAGAHSLVRFEAGAIEVEGAKTFAPGSAQLSKPMERQLAWVAQRLQGLVDRGVDKVVVLGFPDSAKESEAATKLALARAEAVSSALEKLGIPKALLRANGADYADLGRDKTNYLVTVRLRKRDRGTPKAR